MGWENEAVNLFCGAVLAGIGAYTLETHHQIAHGLKSENHQIEMENKREEDLHKFDEAQRELKELDSEEIELVHEFENAAQRELKELESEEMELVQKLENDASTGRGCSIM